MNITEKEHGQAALELFENWHSDAVLDGPDGNITVWRLLELVDAPLTADASRVQTERSGLR